MKKMVKFLNEVIYNETKQNLINRSHLRRKRIAISGTGDSKKINFDIKLEKKTRLIFIKLELRRLISELKEETERVKKIKNLNEKEREIFLRKSKVTNIVNLFAEGLDLTDP